jgi:crotonobetainyl-CoA:carnitine CoA-transferase CaiB-like acyl-CoA transferase
MHGVVHQSIKGEPPARRGNFSPDYFIHGVFACIDADDWILIQVETEAQWRSAVTHIPTLGPYARLNWDELRNKSEEITCSIEEWAAIRSARQMMHDLQSIGITAIALNSASDLMDDPHLLARGYMQFVSHPFMGEQPHPSAPWRPGELAIPIGTSAPTLGQHNREILGGLLGLSDSQLEKLNKDGVIGNKPRIKLP